MKRKISAHVYIMASDTGTLYVGVTSDIVRRAWSHKNDIEDGFTKKYQCHKLVYLEQSDYMVGAIGREKQIKRWRREKKQDLIEAINPSWKDLAEDW